MSRDDLQLLHEFRRETPEPDAETAHRIYELATGTRAQRPSPRVQPRQRRFVLRAAAVAAATAAVAFGVLSVLPDGGVSPVERAAAALTPARDTILHTIVLSHRTNPDGTTSTERTETWCQQSPPYDERSVLSSGGAVGRETGSADGRPEVYLPSTNTISTVAPDVELPRSARPPGETGNRLLDIREFLASGQAREDGRVTVDGRDAVRIAFSGPRRRSSSTPGRTSQSNGGTWPTTER